jgi:D-ribose pyranase
VKKSGIIHPDLSRALAELGHGHQVCIADAGLPIPPGVERIDLAYRLGSPTFIDVLNALAAELVVEEMTVADEAAEHCPEIIAALGAAFPDVDTRSVSHEQFKRETNDARVVIRTGETTPYANVLLTSGVPF